MLDGRFITSVRAQAQTDWKWVVQEPLFQLFRYATSSVRLWEGRPFLPSDASLDFDICPILNYFSLVQFKRKLKMLLSRAEVMSIDAVADSSEVVLRL